MANVGFQRCTYVVLGNGNIAKIGKINKTKEKFGKIRKLSQSLNPVPIQNFDISNEQSIMKKI